MKNKTENTTTPYDDVHRTMINDCPKLIIPVVNEMFHKRHSNKEEVTVLNNEFFINRQKPQKLNELTAVYEEIAEKLNACEENHVIDAYTKSMIVDMSRKVLEHLAMKYSNVKKEVGAIMGGKILEYPTKTVWRQARQEGILELLRDIGTVSEELQKRIINEEDLDVLTKWLKLAAKSDTIEEFVGKM